MPTKLPIVFIDTNILLDAYRSRNDIGLNLIKRLDNVHKHLITSYQVEMEFMKNRQAIILESLKSLKPPEDSITIPAFLSQEKIAKIIKRNRVDTKSKIKELKARIKNILVNPRSHDPVYQIVQGLFSPSTAFHLHQTDKRQYSIRRRAWRRFILGYPPRKRDDTSIGDGINWEWIMECALASNRDVIIVSRDEDFGCIDGDTAFINDWLAQELKEKTNGAVKITLTPKLSEALDKLEVNVTEDEKAKEAESLQQTITFQQIEIPALNAMKDLHEQLRKTSINIQEQMQNFQKAIPKISSFVNKRKDQ